MARRIGARLARRDTANSASRHDQEALRHCQPALRASGSARAHGLAAGVCRDTNGCIVIGGAGLASQHSSPRTVI